MNSIEKMVVETALRDMIRRGRVDICTIREILKITKGIPSQDDMNLLSLLHCVQFTDMPQELLRGLPLLIQRVVSAPEVDWNATECSKLLKFV